jgi:uncharacterized protein (TIGR03066 family)
MNVLRFAFLGCLLAGLVGYATPSAPSAPVEKSNKDKIVGTWQPVVKGEPAPLIEFAKDGKLKVTAKGPDGKAITADGTWEVDGNKLTLTLKLPAPAKEQKTTMTITKLTDTEMTTEDDKGRVEEYKRK